MTPFVWMFISSYEELRNILINQYDLSSLIQLEYSGFDGATVPICTFTLTNSNIRGKKNCFIKLSDFRGAQNQAPRTLEAIRNRSCGWFYEAIPTDFSKIPGSPIAYWVSDRMRNIFDESDILKNTGYTRQGMATSDNNRFLRQWYEVSREKLCFTATTHEDAIKSGKKWFPYNKGGDFRKWYGNQDYVINWENDGKEVLDYASSLYGSPTRTVKSFSEYFKYSISWSKISSSFLAMRYYPTGFIFDFNGEFGYVSNHLEPREFWIIYLTIQFGVNNCVTAGIASFL